MFISKTIKTTQITSVGDHTTAVVLFCHNITSLKYVSLEHVLFY